MEQFVWRAPDSLAPINDQTLQLLRENHPPAHPASSIPPSQSQDTPHTISPLTVRKAIFSFPAGSAGGPDGLRPQHLKDILSSVGADLEGEFMLSLSEFVNLVAQGGVPTFARPFFFGASLIGLNKSDGGVRPIAVGCTLRRLVAKCCMIAIKEEMGSLLAPNQLGFGTSRGCEAVVHAARAYLSEMGKERLLLKLDFSNAFNSIRRDKMLITVQEICPSIFPFVHSAYAQPTNLYFGGHIIPSAEGVQQGDPLGPLLFCLAIFELTSSLKSKFHAFYLDDGILGGSPNEVLSDLQCLEQAASNLGLCLNKSKCELISYDQSIISDMLSSCPGLICIDPADASLLGSPIGGQSSIDSVLRSKIDSLQTLGDRLTILHSHDALCLLRHAVALPKLLYVLRTAPRFTSTLHLHTS